MESFRSNAAAINEKTYLSPHAREVLTSRAHNTNFPSLQHLAAKCIWMHKQTFDHPRVNIFNSILDSLKTDLLTKFTNSVRSFEKADDLARRTLILLLNPEVVKFTFPDLLVARKASISATLLWKSLLLKCPELQEVCCYAFAMHLDEHAIFFKSLMPMKHLQVIKLIGFWCDDTNLCPMAEQMPDLRVLEVMLSESASEKGFKALSNLQHLEEFIFFVNIMYCRARINAEEVYKKNLILCMQHLPKLRIAGERIDHQYAAMSVTLGQATAKELLQMTKPQTFGLQEATLYQVSSIPVGILLPNLTTLYLLKPSGNFKCDWSLLSSLTKLGLYEVTMATCLKILNQTVHRQVKKLAIHVTDVVFVDRILQVCPKLECLSVVESPKKCLKVSSRIETYTLRQLTVLELLMRRPAVEYVIDPEAILQLLQAPNLRKLELRLVTLQQKEAEEIVRRLRLGEILQKLESAILEPHHEPHVENPFKEERDRMDWVTSSMVLHCPKLIEVFNESEEMFRF